VGVAGDQGGQAGVVQRVVEHLLAHAKAFSAADPTSVSANQSGAAEELFLWGCRPEDRLKRSRHLVGGGSHRVSGTKRH
jgi:hypothetical protein